MRMSSWQSKGVFFSTAFAVMSFVSSVYYYYWIKRRKKCMNTFEFVGYVSDMNVYPIKSCKPVKAEKSTVTTKWFEAHGIRDRHFLVGTEDGTWQNQKKLPKMALIRTKYDDPYLQVSAPDMDNLVLPTSYSLDEHKIVTCKTVLGPIQAVDCGDAAAEWFSTFLDRKNLRLFFAAPELPKRELCNEEQIGAFARPGEKAAFNEFGTCLLISEESVKEFNKNLTDPITTKNFRPNIVIKGNVPFDEDNWDIIKIGGVKLRNALLCPRCAMTSVNPDTGDLDKNLTTFKTLKKHRNKDLFGTKAPCFGLMLFAVEAGNICIGDEVYALRKV